MSKWIWFEKCGILPHHHERSQNGTDSACTVMRELFIDLFVIYVCRYWVFSVLYDTPTLPSIRVGGTSQNKSHLNQNESLLNYLYDYIMWYNNQNESLLKIKNPWKILLWLIILKDSLILTLKNDTFCIKIDDWYPENTWLTKWISFAKINSFWKYSIIHTYSKWISIIKINLNSFSDKS